MNPDRKTIDNPSGDACIDRLRGVPTEGDIDGLAARNEARAKKAAKSLGAGYCLHPINSPIRKDLRRPPAPPKFLLHRAA